MQKINRGMNLPDDNHVMRRVSSSKLRRDENDKVIGFNAQAFALRPNEESLSVNWLEHFEGDHDARAIQTIQELRSAQNISKKSAFGIANVSNIKEICKKNRALVKIVYAPTDNIPSHSEIRRLPSDDLSLQEALATEAFCILILNGDIEE